MINNFKLIDEEWYEKDLKDRQKKHLENMPKINKITFQPCAHDSCPECVGTGKKKDGTICIHHMVCSCPKCGFYV